MDRDEEDQLLLAVSQFYEIECAVQRGNTVFKYSSPGIIIDCLNPLEVSRSNFIKAHPELGWWVDQTRPVTTIL